MAKVADHISTLRALNRLYSKPNIPFSDSFLAGLIIKVAGWFQARSFEKGGKLSDFDIKSFPVKLSEDTTHGFSCFPGCKAMVSLIKIPKPIRTKNRDIIKVSTLDGREMHFVQPSERIAKSQDEFFQNQYMYSIINGKLVVYSKKKPTVVLVSGIWADLSEWMDLPACDDTGEYTGSTCIDPRKYDVPLDNDNVIGMYQEVLRLLQIPIQIKGDDLNNLNNQI